jgi:hypothetical protein
MAELYFPLPLQTEGLRFDGGGLGRGWQDIGQVMKGTKLERIARAAPIP